MVTCPWCGTNYQTFQSNCTNCGGPLPASEEKTTATGLIAPPPAPRPISQTYLWRLLFSDGWAIAAFVLSILGFVFTLVGGGLSTSSITAFVGIPFAVGGFPLLVAGLWIFIRRYQEMQHIVNVLREGQPVLGQITDVEANYSVEINGQTPWNIRYKFKVIGQEFTGSVTSLRQPGPQLQAGQDVYVLYSPDAPMWNSIYPHP